MTAQKTFINSSSSVRHQDFNNNAQPAGSEIATANSATIDSIASLKTFIAANPGIEQTLSELEQMLSHNMFIAINRFKELQSLFVDNALSTHFTQLGKLINQMKFEEAHQELQLLLQTLTDCKSG